MTLWPRDAWETLQSWRYNGIHLSKQTAEFDPLEAAKCCYAYVRTLSLWGRTLSPEKICMSHLSNEP